MLASGKGRESRIAAADNVNKVLKKPSPKVLYDNLTVILKQFATVS